MTEDIVEFGAAPAARRKRARPARLSQPRWMADRMLPVAGLGAVAGAASLAAPWQKIVFKQGQGIGVTLDDSYHALLISLGALGSGYIFVLVATVVAVAVVFYGHQGAPGVARVIGAALSAANLALLTAMALALNQGTAMNVGFVLLSEADKTTRMSLSLDWGFYAALAAVLALGVAALRAQPIAPGGQDKESRSEGGDGFVDGDEVEPDGDVMDLSVSVHPLGKQVAAG